MADHGRRIGPGNSVYATAKLSANHRQSFDQAESLVRAAKATEADAVKLQKCTADTLTTRSDRPEFRFGGGITLGSPHRSLTVRRGLYAMGVAAEIESPGG
jgi:sialic acid synthase SpsE